jgi:hypothetical protein
MPHRSRTQPPPTVPGSAIPETCLPGEGIASISLKTSQRIVIKLSEQARWLPSRLIPHRHCP